MSDLPLPALATELSQRELLLSEAERIVHLGSWMWDTSTNAIWWSDELYRIYGLPPRSVEPTVDRFFSGIHVDDLALVQDVAARGVSTRRPEPVDFRIIRPDGSTRHVHMEAAVVEHAGAMRLVGSLLDVTERLELEARLLHSQKMEAIGTLAGGVAHDFNNYLQVIFGHVDLMLARGTVDAAGRASLSQVQEAARRCQRLTQQLLSFSRRQSVTRERVDIDTLVDRVEPMIESLVGDGVRVRRVRGRVPIVVACDPAALEQVLLNLASNARDAMPRGGRITLETDTVVVDEDLERLRAGRYVRVSVEDEGAGIAEQDLPRIFEPFFTTKATGHGTGLGLATSWGIIEQHGGTIQVESVLGRGSVLRVLLPCADPEASTPSEPPPTGRRTILVVEDQAQVRALVRAMLEPAGYDVLEAEHGRDALRVLRERGPVELVLTDVSMPVMSGLELARRLEEGPRPVPVVLMTGVPDSEVDASQRPVLRKPFERELLLRVVAEWLA